MRRDGSVAGAGRRGDVRGRRRRVPARATAWRRARSCSTPRSPATRRSSPIRRTRARSSRSPTRTSATTASTSDDDEARAPRCRGVIVRDLARRPSNWRATDDLDGFLARHEVAGHRRHRHPPPHPPHPRRGRDARRVRHRRPRHAARGRAGRRRHRRPRSRRRGHHAPSRTPSVPTTRASTSSRTTSGSSARSSTSSSRRAARSRSCPRRRPAADVLAREPDGVFLSNGPGDPGGGRRRARRACGALLGKRAGVRHLPRPPDHEPRARRGDVQAALRPSRRQPSGAPPRDRAGRDHEPEPQLRGRRRLAARGQRRSRT